MTIEQLIVLFLFVVVPLIQAAREALAKRRASHAEREEEEVESTPFPPLVPEPPVYVPPPRPTWKPEVVVAPPPRPVRAEAPRPPRAPVAPAKPRPVRPQPASSLFIASDPNDVRKAIVAMTVLGPPRALDPYAADRS